MRAPCSIDGCERTSAGRGWCQTHWTRWRKYGDPLFVKQRGVDWQVPTTCSVDDCEVVAHAHGYCTRHLYHWQRHGDPLHQPKITGRPLKGEVPTFGAVHRRLKRTRGPASNHVCVDCGGPARDWSYNNADPAELFEVVRGSRLAYSLDPDNYDPRCVSCHRKFDRAGDRPRDASGQFLTGASISLTALAVTE